MSNPYPINSILKFVVKIWMFFFIRSQRISANIAREVRNINEPYLLLSNHYGRYDPFIVSYWFRKRPNFVSSDAILRDRIIGTLFKGLGAMPKKKGVRDSSIIREMVKVIKANGALALFPEGTRTWNGTTSYMDPSIAKLVKLLKVPVITARMKGAYAMDPRWAIPVRKAQMEIDYNLIIQKDEIGQLTEQNIFDRIWNGIFHDDTTYQQIEKIKIDSKRRAENIEMVLWQCPECLSTAGFESRGNDFSCKHCASSYSLDEFGFIKAKGVYKPKFTNLRDWINWQNENFVELIRKKVLSSNPTVFFSAGNVQIDCAMGNGRMKNLGTGEIYFFRDRLEIKIDEKITQLKLSDISSLGAQFKERIELFYDDYAYRFTSLTATESGLKWELATNVVWAATGQEQKVAAYFSKLVVPQKKETT